MMLIDPFRVSYSGPVILEHLGGATSATTATTHSFIGFDIGDPDPNRLIIVAASFHGGATGSITSLDIAGNTATGWVQDSFYNLSVGLNGAAIFALGNPTDLTADIDVALSTPSAVRIEVYRAVGSLSHSVGDTAQLSMNALTTATINCDVLAGGALVAIAGFYSQDPTSITAGVTEEYYETPLSLRRAQGGSLQVASDETSRAITLARTSGTLSFAGGFVAASFR